MKANRIPWIRLILLSFLVLSSALAAYFILPEVIKIDNLNRQEQRLTRKLYDKENKKIRLELQLKELKTDPVAVEKVARDEMGLSKDNEIIYKFTK
ncbi:septum formation initiator family protein [bacterium]|nr:septum formation initiator family protein [bacterium]